MTDIDEILRELADDPAEYARQAGFAVFVRHGQEHTLSLKELPGIGVATELVLPSGDKELVPILKYVQQHILGLPRLGAQIVKAIDRSAQKRPSKFVDPPSEFTVHGKSVVWEKTSVELRQFLNEPEAGTTRLVQLMATAGQGKTVLLEQVARENALAYRPDAYPLPLLLVVDLLGRYVGNVDDAIAGSLSNAYMFPSLTQRDVALCVRNRWLILALDGFDELVARIGARDAFLRITELLEQLGGSGTVILSARESFFELYQITAAVRSYLQPRQGSYDTSVIRLLPWTRVQGESVFASLGSADPKANLTSLLASFSGDEQIVLQPFFLTRLAALWTRGERFAEAPKHEDVHWRIDYIIKTFIERESKEKWADRDKRPLLSVDEHTTLLAGIAEEMWRSGAFRLTAEELRLSAELALSSAGVSRAKIEAAVERIPTHAAITAHAGGYAFLHDRFLQFYLGTRLAAALGDNTISSLTAILGARQLNPDLVGWATWFLGGDGEVIRAAVVNTLGLSTLNGDRILRDNVATVVASLLAGQDLAVEIEGLGFSGDVFREKSYNDLLFRGCELWQLDLTGSVFKACIFDRCEFGEVLIDSSTRFGETVFRDTVPKIIEEHGQRHYDPDIILKVLQKYGAKIEDTAKLRKEQHLRLRVPQHAADCLLLMVRWSERTTDVAIEDVEEKFLHGRLVAKLARESGVARAVSRDTSGPRKNFIRFQVDKDLLLRGLGEKTGDERIDNFWTSVAGKVPQN